MIKTLIYSVGLLLVLNTQSCKQVEKPLNSKTTKQSLTMVDSIPQFSKEEQVSYALHFNTRTPYELYLDDILIKHEADYAISQTIQLNPYLLENGMHSLRIRYLPRKSSEDRLLHPEHVRYSDTSQWGIYFLELKLNPEDPLGYEGEIDYPNSRLEIIAPPTPVAYWDQVWELEIKNLPYEILGWRDGEDLSKWDQEELEKEVVAYYNKLRDMLHGGRAHEFMGLIKRMNFERAIATYSTQKEYEYYLNFNLEDLILECPNNMWAIENYTMKLHAYGKIVRLYLINDKARNNWGALISENDDGDSYSWGMKLYKPKGSDTFVPIRQ